MSVTHYSLAPTGFLSSDPLGLESEGPTDLEDRVIIDDPCALEQMDQSEELDHVARPGESTLSSLSDGPSGTSDQPIDVTIPPSEQKSRLGQPTTSQGTGLCHSDQYDSSWWGGESGL